MDPRYEKLPELGPNSPKRSPREPDPVPEVETVELWGTQQPIPDAAVSQWKLQKLIIEAKGLALGDLCWLFQIEDRDDERIWFGLNQLLRAGRIREIIGTSRKTGQMGKIFIPTEKAGVAKED